jgi:hypothetical protein
MNWRPKEWYNELMKQKLVPQNNKQDRQTFSKVNQTKKGEDPN